MTTELAIQILRPQLASIVEDVFRTMLGASVDLAELAEFPSKLNSALQLTAAIYYAGSWKGALIVECSSEQAMQWTSSLMSLDPPVSIEDARDGLGEVTNMIAGNLKPLLSAGVGLSIPSVVEGVKHKLRLVGDYHSEVMIFMDPCGPFRVSLVQDLSESI